MYETVASISYFSEDDLIFVISYITIRVKQSKDFISDTQAGDTII